MEFLDAPEYSSGRIGEKQIEEAAGILEKYKSAKQSLTAKIIDDEKWWKLQHWDTVGQKADQSAPATPRPTSAWTFNAIINKHADMMDNMPEAVVLPREKDDEEAAHTLNDALPRIMDYNGFPDVYSSNAWEKIKHGTSVFGVLWDSEKENGAGEISITKVPLSNIYWEPGISNIQDSRNVFTVKVWDNDTLIEAYPGLNGKLNSTNVASYVFNPAIDTTDKSLVVDWYYKRKNGGKTVLHMAKFVGDVLLYASENEPETAETGIYNHGRYPFVFDVMYPEPDMPAGFGEIAVCRDPQLFIDSLSGNILETAHINAKTRYFTAEGCTIDEEAFKDVNRVFVPVHGAQIPDESVLRPIVAPRIDAACLNVVEQKINEMKETSGNRDVNAGSTGSGVTSGAAISALQEAGGKINRDISAGSRRAYADICWLVTELVRQFYTVPRSFRIDSKDGAGYEFTEIGAENLADVPTGMDADGNTMYRHPVFDFKIKVQRQSPYHQLAQNERAIQLYQLGFFSPDRAQESLGALEMMSFEGIEAMKDYIRKGSDFMAIAQNLQRDNEMLRATVDGMREQIEGMTAPAILEPEPPTPMQGAPMQASTDSPEGAAQADMRNRMGL